MKRERARTRVADNSAGQLGQITSEERLDCSACAFESRSSPLSLAGRNTWNG